MVQATLDFLWSIRRVRKAILESKPRAQLHITVLKQLQNKVTRRPVKL